MNVETLGAIAAQKLDQSVGVLRDFREAQLGLFKENGFHSPILDGYKFTNMETFFAGVPFEPKTSDVNYNIAPVNAPTLSFVNGVLSDAQVAIPGVKIKQLKDHFNEVRDLFKSSNALSHLHHSLLNEGIILEVEKNKEIELPIRIVHSLTKTSIFAPTVVVIAHHFSKISILEEAVSTEVPYANVGETYIHVHDGAKVEHIQLDQGGKEGVSHASVFADVARDGNVRSFIFNTSGKLNRKNLEVNLNNQGAHGESFALFLTNGTEHSDINTVIHHHAADTTSEQIAKGILDGDSKGVFTGLIHIHPKAQRVASGQLNKNLLLSKKAQVHSQPQLEIFADDVKCSHGSTTGQLSDDEVFYLEARGIPAEKARVLLAHGFGLEIVQKIDNKVAREYLSSTVMKTLETKFELGRIS